ncbi:MAG: polysaccharide deacetylase family protein [Planctomycetota bacterium]
MIDAVSASASPLPQATITTSWDDGHLADLRLADLLETYRIPATFYIPQFDRLADKPVLEPAQLHDLADRGFEIGAHTINHTVLPTVADKVARQEIIDSRHYIADATGRKCVMFCAPQGKFTAAHLGMIRDAGFAGLRTVEMWSTDPPRPRPRPRKKSNSDGGGLVEMPTTLQAHPQSNASIARNLLKRRAVSNAWLYLKHGRAAANDWPAQAAALLDHVLAHGGVFHLWGHSWELEAYDQWARLEAVLAKLQAAADRATLSTNAQVCAAYASANPSITTTT